MKKKQAQKPAQSYPITAIGIDIETLSRTALRAKYALTFEAHRNMLDQSKQPGELGVDAELRDFPTFLRMLRTRPDKSYSLERADRTKPYSASNCFWARAPRRIDFIERVIWEEHVDWWKMQYDWHRYECYPALPEPVWLLQELVRTLSSLIAEQRSIGARMSEWRAEHSPPVEYAIAMRHSDYRRLDRQNGGLEMRISYFLRAIENFISVESEAVRSSALSLRQQKLLRKIKKKALAEEPEYDRYWSE